MFLRRRPKVTRSAWRLHRPAPGEAKGRAPLSATRRPFSGLLVQKLPAGETQRQSLRHDRWLILPISRCGHQRWGAGHKDGADYLQSTWWTKCRLVFLIPKNSEPETPTFVMYGLSNPPMGREGDPRLDHWYEANLSIETHVLKLLANRIRTILYWSIGTGRPA
jgi:hypothetical protein